MTQNVFNFRLSRLGAILITCVAMWPALGFAYGEEVIVDNSDPGFSVSVTDDGAWISATAAAAKYGPDYIFAHSTGSTSVTTGTATWQPDLPLAGDYDVYAWWTQGANRSTDAPYTMHGPNGSATVRVNQQANGGQWNLVGRHYFAAGTSGTVTLTNNAGGIVCMADAVRFVYVSEIRAFWASRFEWPHATPSIAQQNIVNIMDAAADHNFNTVLLQVRGQMDVHYNSPYEPWTNTYNWTNPGWDPLQFALDEAHSRGLEFHAYVNTHTLASPVPPANTVPQHMYNLHGPAAPPGADNWTIHDTNGNPLNSTNSGLSNYYWLSPGIPEASWHTRRAMVHLATTYDVDGIHYDRIRTPGPGYSYDPISLARFNGDGNPDALSWEDFMRSQFTRDLRNIYAEVYYHKPHIKISSAPIGINKRTSDSGYQGWGNAAFPNYYQDSYAWMKAHTHDYIVPQTYWELGSNHAFETLMSDWLANVGDRYLVSGSRTGRTIASDGLKPLGDNEVGLLDEQQETRNQNAAGHCVFSYGSLQSIAPGESMSYFDGFATYNYDQPTTSPEMPWKTRPTTGYITGYLLDGLGNPVLDGRVNLAGDEVNYLSAYDGFFSMLDVPAATTHTLTGFKLGLGSVEQGSITVAAGQVTSLTLTLNSSRGIVDFHKPKYDLAAPVVVRVFDADLVGAGSIQVQVTSTAEPAGETVTLDELTTSPGRFERAIILQDTFSPSGDSVLRAVPGGTLTVTYADMHDGISAGPHVRTDTAPIPTPADVIVETRGASSGGPRTATPTYQEVSGTWADTGNVGAPSVVIKSRAPGLLGLGGRYSGSVGASARFRPPVASPGFYDVYVTLPNGVVGSGNDSPGAGFTITHDGGIINGTVDLSRFNPAITDQWLKIASGVKFAAGNSGSIQFTNNNPLSNTSNARFSMDAIKLTFVQQVPVSVSGFSVE